MSGFGKTEPERVTRLRVLLVHLAALAGERRTLCLRHSLVAQSPSFCHSIRLASKVGEVQSGPPPPYTHTSGAPTRQEAGSDVTGGVAPSQVYCASLVESAYSTVVTHFRNLWRQRLGIYDLALMGRLGQLCVHL